ncbi:DUF397 domain-containing protein [Nocardia sp. CNY236]|uniref:DUF397 domain-containing protein n=1 Tax=Nocardia sp. CNY236 TaxID=1169152 RepID=UPI001E3A1DA8|nr:DUF397 domain-containing protein [Nocardia sp. CNY236]
MSNTIAAGHRPLDGYVKASASDGGGQCVLVRRKVGEESIFIRDSKYSRDPRNRPDKEPVIEMPAAAWGAFQAAVLGGSPWPAVPGQPHFDEAVDGGATLLGADGTTLFFTAAEWTAFKAGLGAGEFDPQQIAA